MILTRSLELDRAIGGLKKGKLYGLATLNLDRIAAEYFALDILEHIQKPAFFHTLAGSYLTEYTQSNHQCDQLFFNDDPNENAEDVCEKFEFLYQMLPFELAVIDIDRMNARDRKQFLYPQYEIKHIIKLFQALAEQYKIPVVLICRYYDQMSDWPGEQLNPHGYPRSLIETAEKILVISKTSRWRHIWDISIYDHFVRKEILLVDHKLKAERLLPESEVDGIQVSEDRQTLLRVPENIDGVYKIPDGITAIAPMAFYDCYYLTEVIIPDSVTRIGTAAFYNCVRLTGLIIPDNVRKIENCAFEGCSEFCDISLPARFKRRKCLGISCRNKVNFRKKELQKQ